MRLLTAMGRRLLPALALGLFAGCGAATQERPTVTPPAAPPAATATPPAAPATAAPAPTGAPAASGLQYFWPSALAPTMIVNPVNSTAHDDGFTLDLRAPDGGQFSARVTGGSDTPARPTGSQGTREVKVRGQSATAFSTGAGWSIFWEENGHPYAVSSGFGIEEAMALANGLEPLSLSDWATRLTQ